MMIVNGKQFGFNKDTKLKDVADDVNKLIGFLRYKGWNHNFFKSYATKGRWKHNIIDDKCFYLSNGVGWNDPDDSIGFNSISNDYVNFGMCFSSSKSENVAMWMLYGDKGKNGEMISLGKMTIHNILKKCTTIDFGRFDGEVFNKIYVVDINQLECEIVDILYYGKNDDVSSYTVVRGSETFKNVCKKTIESLSGYKKSIGWKYEQESRLIIRVKKNNLPEDILEEKYFLALHLNKDEIEKIKIIDAPNKEIEENEKSELRGKIHWNLCDNCEFHQKRSK